MAKPRGPAPRAPLRRARIVAAAVDALTEDGLDGLSLRRLAGRLGVTAPALYAHVRDKADLLRALADEALERLNARFAAVTAPDPWVRLRGLADAYVDFSLEHPALFTVLADAPPGLLGSSAFDLLHAAASEATGPAAPEAEPHRLAVAVWAAAHGVATVLRLTVGHTVEDRDALLARVMPGPPRGRRSR